MIFCLLNAGFPQIKQIIFGIVILFDNYDKILFKRIANTEKPFSEKFMPFPGFPFTNLW